MIINLRFASDGPSAVSWSGTEDEKIERKRDREKQRERET